MSGLHWTEKVQGEVEVLVDFPVFPGRKPDSGSVTATQVVGLPVGRDALPGQSGHQPNPSLAEIRIVVEFPVCFIVKMLFITEPVR